jgi:hypothetical protein
MTRDEALRHVRATFESSVTERQIADFVDALAILGVLQLEEQYPMQALAHALSACGTPFTAVRVNALLESQGYKIFRDVS